MDAQLRRVGMISGNSTIEYRPGAAHDLPVRCARSTVERAVGRLIAPFLQHATGVGLQVPRCWPPSTRVGTQDGWSIPGVAGRVSVLTRRCGGPVFRL